MSNAKTHEDKVSGLQNLNALKVEHNLDFQGDMLLVDQKGLGGRLLKTPGKALTNPKLKFRNLESMEDVQTFIDKIEEQDKQAANLEMKNVVEQQNKEEANKKFVSGLLDKRIEEQIAKINESRDEKNKLSNEKMKELIELEDKKKANKKFISDLSTKRLNELAKNFSKKRNLASIDEVFADPKYRDLNLKLGLDRSVLNKAISEENMDVNLGLRNIFKKVGR